MEEWNVGLSKDIFMFEKGVAVIGSTTIDENITPSGRWRKVGGVTAYSGITYDRDGLTSTCLGPLETVVQKLQFSLPCHERCKSTIGADVKL